MSELSVVGKLVKIGETNVSQEHNSHTREFVIEIPNSFNPEKPTYSVFEIYSKLDDEHDAVSNLEKFNKVGDLITVDFNLRGFTWISKKDTKWNKVGDACYMNKLSAWRVRKADDVEVVIENEDIPDFAEEEYPF